MSEKHADLLRKKCSEEDFAKLADLRNPQVMDFVGEYVRLCNPASVFVRSAAPADAAYIRAKSVERGEESTLAMEGHTAHFDGALDQARDKENTKFLVGKGMELGGGLNCIDRDEGLAEIRGLLGNIMEGSEAYVLFLCLGPVDSPFSIYAVQVTDSAYVAHSEDMLYRGAYEAFKRKGPDIEFFKYVHSSGELEGSVSKNPDKRRIYVDFLDDLVYSCNTQYAGNTVGLKKLSLRLAIRKADAEGWLAEHMFLMAVHGPGGRKTYLTGAFPSFCGKTSTCMVHGESIVGDDIAYLRKIDGKVRAVNVERGIFGIIRDVNSEDDPLIWNALTTPGEVIFGNVLVAGGVPYWQGDGRKAPGEGVNYSGKWDRGKKSGTGEELPLSHANARYTVRLESLANCDPALDDPRGAEVKGIVYGGRDSDTSPPVFQSFDWAHGVVTAGASLESETTAATLGKEGVRKFNAMANLDFLSISLGRYIEDHLDFVNGLAECPVIFGVNYFQRAADGSYLTGMQDKRVWLKWIELRLHGEVQAIKTPIGFLPQYGDLARLFSETLQKEYPEKDYAEQFVLRVPENLAKIKRVAQIYRTQAPDCPGAVFRILDEEKARLETAAKQFGEAIAPDKFEGQA